MIMKKLFVYLLIGGGFMIASCNGGNERVEQEVIGTDTVGAEYEVEKQVQERIVEVDTITEDTTIERNP